MCRRCSDSLKQKLKLFNGQPCLPVSMLKPAGSAIKINNKSACRELVSYLERNSWRERGRERERDREKEGEKERDRENEGEKGRERKKERDRGTKRQRDRQRETEKERERERNRETQRQRERCMYVELFSERRRKRE